MNLPRRDFLKLLGVATGAVGVGGCGRMWQVPDRLVDMALRGPGLESHVQTVCGLCQGGCGITVRLIDGLPVGIKGNPRHPTNRGGLCPVGLAGLELLYGPERLQSPLRKAEGGGHRPITWEVALDEISAVLTRLRDSGEGRRIALLSDEPGDLFHDLAGRFVLAQGSAQIARTEDAGALPYTLTQGLASRPGFDLAGADLVLSFGLDIYDDGPSPLHAITALVGSRPTEDRATLLYVGTRMSPTAAKAEERVPVNPGSHGAFALGVANVLVREGLYDRRFVAEHTTGFEDGDTGDDRTGPGFRRLLIERYYPDRVAQFCGCDPSAVVRVAHRLARASSPVVVAGGEAASGSNATWTGVAAHSLNALLGAFDRPGGVVQPPPIPLTPLAPLPDRAVLPGPPMVGDDDAAAPFGLDPVEALAERAMDGSSPVEVLFVVNSNPVHDSSAGERLRSAFARIPLVVAFASFADETTAAADLVLPVPVYLESWIAGTTPPGLGFSVLGLGRPVVEPLVDARHPGDIFLELARRTGPPAAPALPWESYEAYLKHRLAGLAASGQGAVITGTFEESWNHFLEERGWRFQEHKDLADFWDSLVQESGWWNPVLPRGDWERMFPNPTGRFRFFSHALAQRFREGGEASPGGEADEAFLPHHEPPRIEGDGDLTLVPFRPITARGRLGVLSPMVLEMFGFPHFSGWQTWAELAPDTAHAQDLADGDRVIVESTRASIEAVVRVMRGTVPGTVHMPLGLGHRDVAGAGRGIGSNPVELLAPVRDSLGGILSMTSTRVRLRLLERRAHGGPAPIYGSGH